jgi:regulation of enolase protein 1 (concanavalin A-like superfamily)
LYLPKICFLILPILVPLALAGPVARAATLTVPAGGDLQAAINSAQPGDTILIQAGASFVGSFILPNKNSAGTDADWITIRTSAPDSQLPPAGQRITPAYSQLMPKLISRGLGEPALQTEPRAHHYRIIGIEFAKVNPNAIVYDLVKLGSWGDDQNTLDRVPHHLVFDRCYIHGDSGDLKRGVALNSASTEILNSYLSDIHVRGQEAQAICGWNGPGPFRIINNYIEAAGENLMFGGALPDIPNLIPSDIEIRRNHIYKQPSWRGVWTVKNLLEMKNARRVLVDGNLLEYCWTDAQQGYAILFTPRPSDSGPAAVVEDITFTNNIVRNVAAVFHIQGSDSLYEADPSSLRTRRIQIANNLFTNIDGAAWAGDGCFMKIGAAQAVTVEHNTILQTGAITKTWGGVSENFIFRNNIARHNEYGISGDYREPGNPTINTYFPGSIITANAIITEGSVYWNTDQMYPPGNFFPGTNLSIGFIDLAGGNFRLAASSAYRNRGTDGRDIGVDIDALEAAIAGSAQPPAPPPPTPAPTPQPNASPSVSITSPGNGTTFSPLQTITVEANAADSDGTITKVEFYAGSMLIGTEYSAPYSITWSTDTPGNYALTAKATDNAGAATVSAPVNITVGNSASGGLPAPWTSQDIGGVGLAGRALYRDGSFRIEGSGTDIWNNSDEFHFVYQPVNGNGEIVARVTSVYDSDQWAKAGVMMRGSLAADAPQAMMVLTPGNGLAFQRRTETGGSSSHTSGGWAQSPVWVRLSRNGNVFSAYFSGDGQNWQLVGTETINMGASIYIGLAVTSHNNSMLCTATLDNVRVSGESKEGKNTWITPLPPAISRSQTLPTAPTDTSQGTARSAPATAIARPPAVADAPSPTRDYGFVLDRIPAKARKSRALQ